MVKIIWKDSYKEFTERNIGLISPDEQELLRNTQIAVFGTGGMGGRVAEILVRSGCENVSIIDKDVYSVENLSTQNITRNELNKNKVDVLADKFLSINPNLNIHKYYSVDETNVTKILNNVKLACLSLDGPIGSIIVTRECKKRNIPVIEAWSLPYLFAWWFTSDSLDYETCYNLQTNEKSYSEIKNLPNFHQYFRDCIFNLFKRFPKMQQYYSFLDECMEKMQNGQLSLRSFSPFVYMTGSYIALDVIFSGILGRKEMVLAPNIKSIDLFNLQGENFSIKR